LKINETRIRTYELFFYTIFTYKNNHVVSAVPPESPCISEIIFHFLVRLNENMAFFVRVNTLIWTVKYKNRPRFQKYNTITFLVSLRHTIKTVFIVVCMLVFCNMEDMKQTTEKHTCNIDNVTTTQQLQQSQSKRAICGASISPEASIRDTIDYRLLLTIRERTLIRNTLNNWLRFLFISRKSTKWRTVKSSR
jgi:hypothetical protein